MATDFFNLSRGDQAELLLGAQPRTPWNSKMLEKDIWVVWALGALFQQPDAPKYAFKGGTSLSKVFNLIHRFSEDVDVTIDPDHPTFIEGLDPAEPGVSKTQLKRRGVRARERLPEYLAETLKPYFEHVAGTLPSEARPAIGVVEEQPDSLRIFYPSVLETEIGSPYIQESVLLEFGARASTEPSVTKTVQTYLGDLPELEGQVTFPIATVKVMAVQRTFWEKVTLVHFENTRNDRDSVPIRDRYVRHWYDLHQLSSDEEVLAGALSLEEILRKVLHIKATHYGGKGVNYAACGIGKLRVAPDAALHDQLERDYRKMVTAGMFIEQPPSFGTIIRNLKRLEERINSHFTDKPMQF